MACGPAGAVFVLINPSACGLSCSGSLYESHGCDRDEQGVWIQLTLHGSAERLQLDTLDCGRGMGLEHEATAMAVVD